MTAITESDIKELKDFINSRFDELKADNAQILARINALETRVESLEAGQKQIETRLTAVETRLTAIETRLTVIETRMDEWKFGIQKIPDLAEKIGELKNWRQIIITVITATIGGAIGWFIRSSGFRP